MSLFGPLHASLDIGGAYYGPASGTAVIKAGRLLACIALAIANEEEYDNLVVSLQTLKNKFEEEYHRPQAYHLEMCGMMSLLVQWLNNEAVPNLRLVEVEQKAHEILSG